jgi:anti-sigma regulatory factor (Ser/Thr protein kinase)
MTGVQVLIELEDPSGVAEARHRAGVLAGAAKLDATAAGALAIAVTEAAGNIVKHAGRGKVLLRTLERGKLAGVEALALDHGPGITSIAGSMRDGHSTAGSPGTGLGALQRLTTDLEIWSKPGKGAVLRFEVWPKGAVVGPPAGFSLGAVNVPKPGETECGDDWAVVETPRGLVVFVVDGLGHGPDAARAAHAAVRAAVKHAAMKPGEILDAVHAALASTRGAAAAVALLDPRKELCIFSGVGNIAAGIIHDGSTRNMVSHNGILGHQVRKVQEFQYPFRPGALFLAHSDGLATRWDLGSYPGLEMRHPALVAAVLYRDFVRGRDDVTVVAVRMDTKE